MNKYGLHAFTLSTAFYYLAMLPILIVFTLSACDDNSGSPRKGSPASPGSGNKAGESILFQVLDSRGFPLNDASVNLLGNNTETLTLDKDAKIEIHDVETKVLVFSHPSYQSTTLIKPNWFAQDRVQLSLHGKGYIDKKIAVKVTNIAANIDETALTWSNGYGGIKQIVNVDQGSSTLDYLLTVPDSDVKLDILSTPLYANGPPEDTYIGAVFSYPSAGSPLLELKYGATLVNAQMSNGFVQSVNNGCYETYRFRDFIGKLVSGCVGALSNFEASDYTVAVPNAELDEEIFYAIEASSYDKIEQKHRAAIQFIGNTQTVPSGKVILNLVDFGFDVATPIDTKNGITKNGIKKVNFSWSLQENVSYIEMSIAGGFQHQGIYLINPSIQSFTFGDYGPELDIISSYTLFLTAVRDTVESERIVRRDKNSLDVHFQTHRADLFPTAYPPM